jgi:hypothetical protein
VTHLPCATCGLTRSFAHLAAGDLSGAFARHALGPPLAAELALLWLAAPVAIARAWRPSGALRDRWLLAHAAAFLLFGLSRLAS